MGLSASMWASVSGLLSHGQKMNVVGNNIANVSTIGFKSQRMDFNDYLYRSTGTASGTSQIGAGASVYAILGDYSTGSFESTNSVTDLAIDGNGFFQVRKTNSKEKYYTRAGDFYFNNDRELQNPEGYLLQGWKVNNEKKLTFNSGSTNLGTASSSESAYVGSGTPTDIVLDSWNILPQQTTNVTFTMGLTNDGTGDRTTSETSPMTALFDLWNGASEPPLADTAYATQSSIDVYDEGGATHTLTVYYDQVDTSKTDSNGNTLYSIEGLPAGYSMYEYLVTVPPSEDRRSYGGQDYDPATNTWGTEPTSFYDDPVKGTNKNAGVLMSGVMIFDASGQLVNQTAYSYGATETPDANDQVSVDPSDKKSWQPTKTSSNGVPVFTANFSGQPLANSVSETMRTSAGGTPVSQAQDYIIELDFGLKNLSNPAWNNPTATTVKTDSSGNPIGTWPSAPATEVSMGMDKYGYYQEVGDEKLYGQDSGSHDVYADSTGYYYYDGTNKIYGTTSAGTEVMYDGAYYIDDSGTKCYNTTVVSGAETPAYQNSYGWYYKAGSDDVYGTANGFNVLHDSTGYYYTDGSGTRQDVTSSEFTAITTTAVKPESPTAPLDSTRLQAVTSSEKNSLASLTTISKSTGSSSGIPQFKNVISYGSTVPTMATVERQEYASAANTTSYTVQSSSQDGYASGTLSNVDIDEAGVVYGIYSNGKTIPLYQIALYDFQCTQGLYREGGNLFSATQDSGEPRVGVAGDNGFGATKAYNIEQSNVDMTTEFVQMIATQRGFQANSKGITTVDTMLETVIGMKR
ncbi:flagellar hook-basal body complex protein [Desulfovibrio legallii]|jgi:flagellar hook protein FlgE|uniref:Flagellar hook protein FlgE n=1 Tax=Desulfovibrio legallii TaxID=571438 RepID=A0A6H3FEG5_9BACT|nr:flagellar hook-basal body complex protein [Desulfovibrio legallii]RHH25716.1 flagellar hook-basal body complex protein [Desulfovibrio sp. AM18-2]TBH79927.1 flagellar hook-basal body complex protein [Desulfovibrio legallii]CAI3221388.1 Flagellar hook protein FlgE [Desulfovibrio diazotrophicus]